ncbi:type III secretion system export apparatus subunit SctT [Stenotrophomonas tumulicola]|uniref:Type III secretion system export apparatus subunit SctT n=1 Tax=Stenotrophomonas tumulicola TaxID=1685415 RepID=A0A7W3FMS1_9GAMM|nr:type III secretion system export apparatus subunit SctT [Stenotrophomonas tumulicola]MBA8682062.1 type III secretion system export apparatus subunit SctT [Stenotrophomonas tumulicola]
MHLAPLDNQIIDALGAHAVPATLGIARLLACFAWLPYLSAGALPSRMLRVILALVVVTGLWPVTEGLQRPQGLMGLALAALVEAMVGTVLGLMLALPYHVFHAVGAFVDSQRGAGVGAMLDPLTGVEATELANLMQMFAAVVFLVAGGLVPLMEAVQGSYALVPMGAPFVPDLPGIHAFVGVVLSAALRMAAPVLLLLFLMEVLLGVLSRFAQQLNAFSVSLAIKSFLAFLALLLYLPLALTSQVPALWQMYPPLRGLLGGDAA